MSKYGEPKHHQVQARPWWPSCWSITFCTMRAKVGRSGTGYYFSWDGSRYGVWLQYISLHGDASKLGIPQDPRREMTAFRSTETGKDWKSRTLIFETWTTCNFLGDGGWLIAGANSIWLGGDRSLCFGSREPGCPGRAACQKDWGEFHALRFEGGCSRGKPGNNEYLIFEICYFKFLKFRWTWAEHGELTSQVLD